MSEQFQVLGKSCVIFHLDWVLSLPNDTYSHCLQHQQRPVLTGFESWDTKRNQTIVFFYFFPLWLFIIPTKAKWMGF